MEAEFEKLRKDGLNGVDNLIQWMKGSKIIEDTPDAESRARKLFDNAKDKENIQLENFKEVVGKLAADQNKTAEQVNNMLREGASQLQGALQAAANAFQAAMSSK